jgi:hypothetical protein
VTSKDDVAPLEAHLIQHYDAQQSLMNGKALAGVVDPVYVPEKEVVQVIEETERLARLTPSIRLPRQIQQYNLLVDYLLIVKDADHLKRSLQAHFERLVRYHNTFL